MRVLAADVVQRTRSTALAAARSELLDSLASDLAKGVDPFELGDATQITGGLRYSCALRAGGAVRQRLA